MSKTFTRVSVLAVSAALAFGVSACTPPNQKDSTSTATEAPVTGAAAPKSAAAGSSTAAAGASANAESSDIMLMDGVVRAMTEGSDMTAIFGMVHNNSDKDIAITGFKASIPAEKYEVHEVVDGVMRPLEGGLVIPAGGMHELKPGSDHLMLMGVKDPVMAGEEVEVTLELADGTSVNVGSVPVRTIGAGGESYGDIKGGDHAGHMGGAMTSTAAGADAHAGH